MDLIKMHYQFLKKKNVRLINSKNYKISVKII